MEHIFFFFQAEDGIRDLIVTGVQTCALPIFEAIVEAHYAKSDENRFLDITFRSGRHDYLYRGDLASGAIIAAVVERAKEFAIKRSIELKRESPITFQDLHQALDQEYRENELLPPSD